jgi:hypothetical protein
MIATLPMLRPVHHATVEPKPPYRIRRPADRGERLARLLSGDAMRAGCPVVIEVEDMTPWSSATFNGVVITLTLTACPCPTLSAWLAELPERDLPMGRDIVADLAIEPVDDAWRARALLCLDAANG